MRPLLASLLNANLFFPVTHLIRRSWRHACNLSRDNEKNKDFCLTSPGHKFLLCYSELHSSYHISLIKGGFWLFQLLSHLMTKRPLNECLFQIKPWTYLVLYAHFFLNIHPQYFPWSKHPQQGCRQAALCHFTVCFDIGRLTIVSRYKVYVGFSFTTQKSKARN